MNLKRIRKKFLRDEKKRLERRVFRIVATVDSVLREEFGRRLYRLKKEDEYRLLTLYVWKDRYKVSIRWILKQLIPIWTKTFARFKTKTSLGCRVATLVGYRSEEILREKLEKEYPGGENIREYVESQKEKIEDLFKEDEDDVQVKYSSVLDATNPEKFMKRYRRELECRKKSKMSNKQAKQLLRIKRKPFRSNPYLM